MTDRELLELAAKTAGVDVPKPNAWFTYGDSEGFVWWNMDGTRAEKRFNPLHDDGDALRLALLLRMRVDYVGDQPCVDGVMQSGMTAEESFRRAVVRVAA